MKQAETAVVAEMEFLLQGLKRVRNNLDRSNTAEAKRLLLIIGTRLADLINECKAL